MHSQLTASTPKLAVVDAKGIKPAGLKLSLAWVSQFSLPTLHHIVWANLTVVASGLVDEDTANIVEGVAGAVENQASADRDASLADRLKMAGGDTAGIVGDNVDNQYVSVSWYCITYHTYLSWSEYHCC